MELNNKQYKVKHFVQCNVCHMNFTLCLCGIHVCLILVLLKFFLLVHVLFLLVTTQSL